LHLAAGGDTISPAPAHGRLRSGGRGGALRPLLNGGELDILQRIAPDRPLELQVTEYAPTIWGRSPDARYQAASLCQTIDAYLYAAQKGAVLKWLYWFGALSQFSDDSYFDVPPDALATEEARQKARSQVTTLFLYPRVGGKGVLLAKPIYNCYRMLNHLGTNRLVLVLRNSVYDTVSRLQHHKENSPWQRKRIVSVVEDSWNNRCWPRGPASRLV
jgi:hypothetical protein